MSQDQSNKNAELHLVDGTKKVNGSQSGNTTSENVKKAQEAISKAKGGANG